jgi:phosphoribosylformimino-5-aminoimidazole carboxamide ribotide isomerase
LRRLEDVELALELGATRVVLGTAAVRDPGLVSRAIRQFGAKQIVVGIDARDGRVATHGWTETSNLLATTLARVLADMGLRRIVYTDISRDGMLVGVNLTATVELARSSGLGVIASGGVSGLADIEALAGYEDAGIEGAIIGQALYTGALDLGEALAAVRRMAKAET